MPKCERVEACRNEEERGRGEFAEKKLAAAVNHVFAAPCQKKVVNIFLASAVSASLSADRRGQFWRLLGPQPAEGKSAVVAKRGKNRRGGGKKYGLIFEGEKGGNSRFGCFSFLSFQ